MKVIVHMCMCACIAVTLSLRAHSKSDYMWLIIHYTIIKLHWEINVVEFISTDGEQFLPCHLTEISCTSVCQWPCAAQNLYEQQMCVPVLPLLLHWGGLILFCLGD